MGEAEDKTPYQLLQEVGAKWQASRADMLARAKRVEDLGVRELLEARIERLEFVRLSTLGHFSPP